MNLHVPTSRLIGHPRPWATLFLVVITYALAGCITTRVATEPDCDTPEGVTYSQKTVTAYFWGFKQPTDLKPPCDPRFNHLNGVTVKSTFAHYLLSTVTLGIVNKQQVRWCCAPYVPRRDSL
ncbi:hypothetical protein EXU85_19475 [Spirosoma sp. KCTC 42546]|uniref:hypothetical protein n=1 Tax=Spirosoma sp. KCTC 42546 TaxID=2520506 RepID=UPI00115A17C3|nr:hypothetical protein [Spirosoma sp. KCTC 42546]QDK80669.1 hypothetical protein EXU85_19475 [Spirosoma sp. KCTC 42546]